MDNRMKPLIWSIAAIILIFSILTPLGIITIFALMVPFAVLFVMLSPGVFAGYAAGICAVVFVLGSLIEPMLLPLMLFFMIPAIVMGYCYKKKKPARTALLAGFVTILAQLLMQIVLLSLVLEINLSKGLTDMFQSQLQQFEMSGLLNAGWAEQVAESLANSFVTMLPSLLLLTALVFAAVSHALSRRMLLGNGIEVPGLPPAKTWMLPRSLVWYYLVAWIISLVVPAEGAETWIVIGANLMYVLQLAFTVQGVAFFYFLADVKRWSRAVPAVFAVLAALFHAVLPIFLIGLIDVAFPLRNRLSK